MGSAQTKKINQKHNQKIMQETKPKLVRIIIEAELMEGCSIEQVKQAEVLCCENAKVTTVTRLITADFIKMTKEEILDQIFDFVEKNTRYSRRLITSKKRDRELVYIRALIADTLLSLGDLFNLREIGRSLGGRDHTTVIHYRDNVVKVLGDPILDSYKELFCSLYINQNI